MSTQLLSDAKFFDGYSRHDGASYETWEEAVSRIMDMHTNYYKEKDSQELREAISFAKDKYTNKIALGAQRALQFGGDQLLHHEARMYNCTSTYADRVSYFNETFYMLLCGAGVGFSVQFHHVEKLPTIAKRSNEIAVYTVPDTIEGWSDAAAVLLSSYFTSDQKFPEYFGKKVVFDYSLIRPKGAYISGGFKAPGPEPLLKAMLKLEVLIDNVFKEADSNITKLRPIHVYDITMHISDAVLAGGVRRSACICLFSLEDTEMSKAKTGNWFSENPQRARSNNSAMIIRDEITKEQFSEIMKSVKDFGEPGFIFSDSKSYMFNPCVEIGMLPVTVEGISGFQGCNLVEINGGACDTAEIFYDACRAGAILGTLQAGYTNFKYVSEATKRIFEKEALIGVSITGWMNNPKVLFDKEVLKKGAEIIKATNRRIAKLIGINPAARTTCVKPAGSTSVLLGTASGIHGEHSKRYLRNVQMNKESEVVKLIKDTNPHMVEESVWSANNTDYVVAFPIETKEGSILKKDLMGIKQLEYVKFVQQTWVEYGTDIDLCVSKSLRHNVSNTIQVDDWDAVEDYVFENRYYFAGISFLAASGDKDYNQAPFTEVLTPEEILNKYGVASMFASGLIVEGIDGFNGDLWKACSTVLGYGNDISEETHDNMIQRDFVRRAHQFANNYFNGNLVQMTYCLKDVHLLHKWYKITQNTNEINWKGDLGKKEFTEIATLGAIACNGNACELVF